jgi:hypothetical protein
VEQQAKRKASGNIWNIKRETVAYAAAKEAGVGDGDTGRRLLADNLPSVHPVPLFSQGKPVTG